ncbi:MAG TPA: trypsin [Methylophilaceae bacterium]|nr:trypsin [Methylophilaceae bacterium]HAJ71915.1 trypsin [Methylophilaceae bacterium]
MNLLRPYSRMLLATASASLMVLCNTAYAETNPTTDNEKTLSPYFFVKSDDPNTDQLPLKSTDVKVNITGVIADVVVTQHYRNEGKHALEAKYVFPASIHAAVYGLQMHIGDRVVEAKIREKKQAKAEYEQAKSEGKSASLLEQERPNVFQMNVANILPGDDIAVELHYTETIIPTSGKYAFVYPGVVGPRYNGSVASGSGVQEQWVKTPYFKSNVTPADTFAMDVNIHTPIPLQNISSTSHKIKIEQSDQQHASLKLPANTTNGNRDFILEYSLAGNKIQTGTLLYQGEDENFFMTMIEPPKRVTSNEIVPREYIFIVDVSGSMGGFPLDTAKTLLRKMVSNLRPTDTFNVMLFSGSNTVLAPHSMPANAENIELAINTINQQYGGGSTELLPALKTALSMDKTDTRSRNFVVITDGYVTVEKEAFDLIRNNLNNANVFSFGIGSDVNRFLMNGIAHAGEGEAFIVTNDTEAKEAATKFKQYVESPVWTHLKLEIKGLDAYDIQPEKLRDLYADRPIVVIGKWRGKPEGSVTVSGLTSHGQAHFSLDIKESLISQDNAALRYLWAREKIAELDDYTKLFGGVNDNEIKQITDLGLHYNLLTQYTSFIAVDHIVRTSEKANTVNQPLPLPQGVSELAVGAEVPSTPEPEFYLMFALAGGMGAYLRRRKQQNVR